MNLRILTASAAGAALLILGAAGCTDPTVKPKSTTAEGVVFANQNAYQQLLAKVYAGLALSGQQGPAGNPDLAGLDEGFSQYLRLYWELEELPTDEAAIAWGDQGLQPMNMQTWDASNGFITTMYSRIYYEIVLANDFLRLTTDAQIATNGGVSAAIHDSIQTYRAEARFLRALAYFHAIDFFGNVPLVTAIGTTPPPQSTRSDVYSFAVSELTAIQSSLPKAGLSSSYGRATDQAAEMLLAELYLNAGVFTGAPNWGGAMSAAQAVINSGAFSLASNFRLNFTADNNTSPEIIFQIPQDGLKEQSYGGVTFLEHAACGNSLSNTAIGIDGCWYGIRLKPQGDSLFDTTADHPVGDLRSGFFFTSGQSLGIADLSQFGQGYLAPKYTNMTSTGGAPQNPAFADTDFPVWRLAEAYLIFAEAALRGGSTADSATALTYVNLLRARAYGGASGNITKAQLTLPFVLAERGRELLWEAHRRTDLVRYGLFTGGTYLWAWKGGVVAGEATDACRDLYPFPTNELAANPYLKQNLCTGY
ncbi:MAG TPA: RagB/SusD family nutrient uptake outer membrane protein [Gemmatimonadales bacterium]|nr:RagB/SusD family nutrient uptake outer membrane protein [Gemmatimonadales bacterium]